MQDLILPRPSAFQKIINSSQTGLWTLDAGDMSCGITNYGARVVYLVAPDKDGMPRDIVAGFNSIDEYINASVPYYGATLGRYANRIANATYQSDGTAVYLSANEGTTMLHGGRVGFNARVWEVEQVSSRQVKFHYLSADGEEGFPGDFDATVIYTLQHNTLTIEYIARCDKSTEVNLTNHMYFNLNGEGSGSITDHLLCIRASKYTPVDKKLIPTGLITDVANTPFDFTEPRRIGERLMDNDPQLVNAGGGYDHNFVFDSHDVATPVVTSQGDRSGITVELYTDQPGLQLYTGQTMTGTDIGISGNKYGPYSAFTLEPQHFPDTPNHPGFPATALAPGEIYTSVSSYKFGIVAAK